MFWTSFCADETEIQVCCGSVLIYSTAQWFLGYKTCLVLFVVLVFYCFFAFALRWDKNLGRFTCQDKLQQKHMLLYGNLQREERECEGERGQDKRDIKWNRRKYPRERQRQRDKERQRERKRRRKCGKERGSERERMREKEKKRERKERGAKLRAI